MKKDNLTQTGTCTFAIVATKSDFSKFLGHVIILVENVIDTWYKAPTTFNQKLLIFW